MDRLPDVDTPDVHEAMLEALDEYTEEEAVFQQCFTDEELRRLETVQFVYAYKPRVDVATLCLALERDGYTIARLSAGASKNPSAIEEVTRHLALTSPASVNAARAAPGRGRLDGDLPFHAAAVARGVRRSLSSPALASRFTKEVEKASRSWSSEMRDTFLSIVAHAVLRPMMARTSAQQAKNMKAVRALLAALPAASRRAERTALLEWKHWLELSLAGVLTDLAGVASAKQRRPITSVQLGKIAKLLGDVPADLRTLYEFASNLDQLVSGAELEWLGVDDAVKKYRTYRKTAALRSLWPIATGGADNSACLDLRSGKIVAVDEAARTTSMLAPTLAAFLDEAVRKLHSRKRLPRKLPRTVASALALRAALGLPATTLRQGTAASAATLAACRKKLGRALPGPVKQLLMVANGLDRFVVSSSRLVPLQRKLEMLVAQHLKEGEDDDPPDAPDLDIRSFLPTKKVLAIGTGYEGDVFFVDPKTRTREGTMPVLRFVHDEALTVRAEAPSIGAFVAARLVHAWAEEAGVLPSLYPLLERERAKARPARRR